MVLGAIVGFGLGLLREEESVLKGDLDSEKK